MTHSPRREWHKRQTCPRSCRPLIDNSTHGAIERVAVPCMHDVRVHFGPNAATLTPSARLYSADHQLPAAISAISGRRGGIEPPTRRFSDPATFWCVVTQIDTQALQDGARARAKSLIGLVAEDRSIHSPLRIFALHF